MKITCKVCFTRPLWTAENKCTCGAYLIASSQDELIHNRRMTEERRERKVTFEG